MRKKARLEKLASIITPPKKPGLKIFYRKPSGALYDENEILINDIDLVRGYLVLDWQDRDL